MKARYVEVAGTRVSLRAYWDVYVFDPTKKIYTGKNDCPNSYGHGQRGVHSASTYLFDDLTLPRPDNLGGHVEDYALDAWPGTCDHCNASVPGVKPARAFGDRQRDGWVLEHQVVRRRLYATPDRSWCGMPQVGDMFYADWYELDTCCVHGWTNCNGLHLIVVLPNMRHWDTDGRSSNCALKNDTTHRCWVRAGDPSKGEAVNVSKVGETCSAGAGSIAVPGWHGFLHNGDLHEGCTSVCR